MFEGNIAIILMATLGAVTLGGLAYVFLDPILSGERKSDKRRQSVAAASGRTARITGQDTASQRRRNIHASLKELEDQQKAKRSVPLHTRIEQAGLDLSTRSFWISSVIAGVVLAGLVLITGAPPIVALGALVAGAIGLPRWVLNFLRKRRQAKFLEEFANSIDVIVRGVKSGLPINDCMQMIATEAADPVRGEFKNLVESQRLGVPIDAGMARMFERMPLAEVNFLAIVLAIQIQSGGNLAEALGNLSKVLRDRKKMKGKIKAMSQEAKSSASIIGSLPILVMGIVYLSTPEYIALLWQTSLGQVMMVGSAFWMTCGILVMKKMISFDF
ncbi:MAG: type II secretion system F family protein [Alphaproteobacteria bacterium]